MNPNLDLDAILTSHAKWVREEEGGVSADFRRADLSGAGLHDARLLRANLYFANLCFADFNGANLSGADLGGADLSFADLVGADLRNANLGGAIILNADLRGADLEDADIGGTDLRGSDLSGARLPNGIRWEEYLAHVVPALLRAGGRTLEEIVTRETWNCHAWSNCPMRVAFGAEDLDGVPALYRREAGLLIQLFDGDALPYEVVRQACGLPQPTPGAV